MTMDWMAEATVFDFSKNIEKLDTLKLIDEDRNKAMEMLELNTMIDLKCNILLRKIQMYEDKRGKPCPSNKEFEAVVQVCSETQKEYQTILRHAKEAFQPSKISKNLRKKLQKMKKVHQRRLKRRKLRKKYERLRRKLKNL